MATKATMGSDNPIQNEVRLVFCVGTMGGAASYVGLNVLKRSFLLVPSRILFVGMGQSQHRRLAKRLAEQLQADRQLRAAR